MPHLKSGCRLAQACPEGLSIAKSAETEKAGATQHSAKQLSQSARRLRLIPETVAVTPQNAPGARTRPAGQADTDRSRGSPCRTRRPRCPAMLSGIGARTCCPRISRWPGHDVDSGLSLIHISEPTRLGMISYA